MHQQQGIAVQPGPSGVVEQAIVARFFSLVFQAAVLEARAVVNGQRDSWSDHILVDGRFRTDPDVAVVWLRQFADGMAQTLRKLQELDHAATQEEVVNLYCDLDPQRAERVAVGAAIYRTLESMDSLTVPVLDVLADWFQTDGRTDSGLAWLMDTVAHLTVADSILTA